MVLFAAARAAVGCGCSGLRFSRWAADEGLAVGRGVGVLAADDEPRLLALPANALAEFAEAAGRLLLVERRFALFVLKSQTGSSSTIEPHLHRAR